jgi:hypothetical protein
MPLWQAFGLAVGCVAAITVVFSMVVFWIAGPDDLLWVRLGSLVAVIVTALTISFWIGGA